MKRKLQKKVLKDKKNALKEERKNQLSIKSTNTKIITLEENSDNIIQIVDSNRRYSKRERKAVEKDSLGMSSKEYNDVYKKNLKDKIRTSSGRLLSRFELISKSFAKKLVASELMSLNLETVQRSTFQTQTMKETKKKMKEIKKKQTKRHGKEMNKNSGSNNTNGSKRTSRKRGRKSQTSTNSTKVKKKSRKNIKKSRKKNTSTSSKSSTGTKIKRGQNWRKGLTGQQGVRNGHCGKKVGDVVITKGKKRKRGKSKGRNKTKKSDSQYFSASAKKKYKTK